MAKKLSEDEIRWILSVDATEAYQETHKLGKETQKLKTDNKELRKEMLLLKMQGKTNSDEYKNLNDLFTKNSEVISQNQAKVSALEKQIGLTNLTMNQLKKRAKDLQLQLDHTSKSLQPDVYTRLEKELGDTRNQMDKLKQSGKKTGDVLSQQSNLVGKLTTAVKAFVAVRLVGYLKDLVVSAFNVRKEFAKYEAVLRNTFQSQAKATAAMSMLKQLAQDTPYQLQELTEAYIKMVNRGMIPTEQEIIKLGDLASSQGKSLDQLVEAILDAQTGEFERLKEFGIKANKSGDQVKFTFKGISTEVKFTEKAISNYILSLGTLEGVQGGMAVQMEELEGRASNLADAWDAFLNVIGTRMEPIAKKTLTWLKEIVTVATTAFSSIEELNQATYNKAASDAAKDTEQQIDVMVDRLVKNGMKKKEATERAVALLRQQINADLVKAQEEQSNIEARLVTNLWPKARKNLEKDLQRKKGEVQRYQAELEALDNKIKSLTPDKTPVSDTELKKQLTISKNAMSLKLQEQETAHQNELTILKKNKQETHQTEQFYNLEVLHADAVYYEKRLQLLKDFEAKTTDKKLKADLNKQIVDAQGKLLETQLKRDQEVINALKDNRDKQLRVEEDSYKIQKSVFEKSLSERKITQEQYAALLLMLDASSAEQRLKILQNYQADVTALEIQSGNAKAQAVTEANQAVLDADLKAAQARANQQKTLQNLLKDFKGEFKLTTVGEETDLQLKVLEAKYQALKEMAEKSGKDTTELTAAYERAKTNILQQEENKRNQIRSQYGLLSMKAQYEVEMEQLQEQYEQGTLSLEEFEQAKFGIKIGYLKKAFDYYSGLFSGAINALQQAELSNIDAKYDAEIERAQGNAEEVARLENEKEQKKLDVQKKYADIQFAIKVSQIIADTAVAIMMALGQLGPIAGGIAAALMGVTGAAQVAVANAERKKIKNMTVNGSTSGSGTGSRVVTPGRQSGGKIDVIREQDGRHFQAHYDPDKRGYVDKPTVIVGEGPAGQSKEWVASNDALENPTIAPIIDLLNREQEKGTIRTVDMNHIMRQNLAGFSTGGFISPESSGPAPSTPQPALPAGDNDPQLKTIMTQLITLLSLIRKEGIHAWILYNEFQKTKDLIDKSQNIAKK